MSSIKCFANGKLKKPSSTGDTTYKHLLPALEEILKGQRWAYATSHTLKVFDIFLNILNVVAVDKTMRHKNLLSYDQKYEIGILATKNNQNC
jgi:hypothetical protein